MTGGFKATQISDTVYWVGAVDWSLRHFHGYETSRGTTYNAYLVLADKVTLIDTVKPGHYDEMMSRISQVIDPTTIDYVISNHAELDHAGALPRLIQAVQPNSVFASPKGVEALAAHFHWDTPVTAVRTGDTLNLGNGTIRFIETRMLHWPDSMFSYYEEEGILFSNDAFGMHLACAERFADEVPVHILEEEGAKYFANILLHLSPLVKRLIDQLPSMGLDIKTIASDHGPIFRHNPTWIIDRYAQWAEQKPTNKAVVVYDTMWHSTATMANAVADGLRSQHVRVEVMPLAGAHRSDVLTEVLDAGALIVGSPTINNQIYPTVVDIVNYLKGLKPQNLIGATFGSYGWSGEAVKHLDTLLAEMKIDMVQDGIKVKYVPTPADLQACHQLGIDVASKLKQRIDAS